MFKRVGNLIRGFFGLFVGGLEKQNPEALLELEKENLRKQIVNYNQGLASHAGLCERLISQVKRLEIEDRDLRAKTTALLRADNRNAAGQYALRLQTVERELAENRSQLEGAEKTYQELMSARDVSIKAAQKKIEELKYALSDLKIKKATAELTEMAGGMIRTSGRGIGAHHEAGLGPGVGVALRHQPRADRAVSGKRLLDEAEQKALADQALADFAAKEGLALPSQASAEPASLEHPVKSMGPLPQ